MSVRRADMGVDEGSVIPVGVWAIRLRDRGLACLFVGQVVSQMGDSIYMIALMWLVLELTGSKAAMGTVAALSHLPILLFGLLGGVVADLCTRRRVMLAADAVRALVGFHAVGIPFIVVSRTALVQEWVEPGMRGRVFGLVGTAVVGTTAISCGAVGLLAESVPINVVFGVFGSLATLCGIAGWCYPRLRDS